MVERRFLPSRVGIAWFLSDAVGKDLDAKRECEEALLRALQAEERHVTKVYYNPYWPEQFFVDFDW